VGTAGSCKCSYIGGLNEIGDIHRFPSADRLTSYAGLAPSQRQSADHTFNDHITRQGNKYIRCVLIEAAQHASRFDLQLKAFYERVAARRGRGRGFESPLDRVKPSAHEPLWRSRSVF
jgi:transposase